MRLTAEYPGFTAHFCAVLGPNGSYFFKTSEKLSWKGLPADVVALIKTEPNLKEVYELAIGPNGSFAAIWIDRTGRFRIRHQGLPASLRNWVINPATNVVNSGRDVATLSITLGPDDSFFAFDKSDAKWALPPPISAQIEQFRQSSGGFKVGSFPRSVSLGPDGTFIFISVRGDTVGNSARRTGIWNMYG